MPLDLSPLKIEHPARVEGSHAKIVLVEYLYLDLQVCDRCISTDQVLDDVITTLRPALQFGGYEVEYRKTKMETPELAQEYHFESSPTIRVNGRDICFNVQESDCGCCSDISGTDVDCRIFEYEGQSYEVPPKEMLEEAILKAVFGTGEAASSSKRTYDLPENLEVFYKGKNEKADCGCVSGCC